MLIYIWCDYYFISSSRYLSHFRLFFFVHLKHVSVCRTGGKGGVMSRVIIYNWRSKWFNDCSFMSRSMRYLTKRAYLTSTMNMRFSLISTCCCQFGQTYHHHHWLIAIVPAINLLQPSWAMTTNSILNSSEYNFRKFNLCVCGKENLKKFNIIMCIKCFSSNLNTHWKDERLGFVMSSLML